MILPPAGAGAVRAARRSRPSSAYLLFSGSWVVLVRAEPVLDAAGSPAWGEEGLDPAGAIFAAGVLAFAAAVPAVAFSPLGRDPAPPPAAPPPAAPPGAASNDETGAAARASSKAKAHVLFSIYNSSLCRALARQQGFNATGSGVGGYHFRCITLIRPHPVMWRVRRR
jgi:hypothetical protein